MEIRLSLPCCQFSLINADFWVIEKQITEVLFGRPLFKCICMDLDFLLTNLCKKVCEVDVSMEDGINTEDPK